jgi:SAM-dependent methyltransferase
MSHAQDERERWNRKYREKSPSPPSIPLLLYQNRLTRGRALDLAGGAGENAAILALAGWKVVLVDLSDLAVRRARDRARALHADVAIVQADALRLPLRGPFETIVVTRYVERSLAPELSGLLAPGGTIFCEQPHSGIREEFLVRPGEFPRIFPELEPVLETSIGGCSVFIGRRRS